MLVSFKGTTHSITSSHVVKSQEGMEQEGYRVGTPVSLDVGEVPRFVHSLLQSLWGASGQAVHVIKQAAYQTCKNNYES